MFELALRPQFAQARTAAPNSNSGGSDIPCHKYYLFAHAWLFPLRTNHLPAAGSPGIALWDAGAYSASK